jgi:hypothetical protein
MRSATPNIPQHCRYRTFGTVENHDCQIFIKSHLGMHDVVSIDAGNPV